MLDCDPIQVLPYCRKAAMAFEHGLGNAPVELEPELVPIGDDGLSQRMAFALGPSWVASTVWLDSSWSHMYVSGMRERVEAGWWVGKHGIGSYKPSSLRVAAG